MKLANVQAMTDNFINEKVAGLEQEDKLEENEEQENLEEQEEEPVADDELGDEMEMDMDMDMGADMDVDMDAEPEMGAADMSLTEEEAEVLIALGERLQAAMGEEDMDDGMDDMDDMPAADDPEPEAAIEDEDEVVQEVLKRVTRRLLEARIKSRK